MSHTQAIIFNKRHWRVNEAKNWIAAHGYHPIKPVHTTARFHRFRLAVPNSRRYHYRTKKIGDGIELILGFPNR